MNPYPLYTEQEQCKKTHVTGPTVEAHNSEKQETKENLNGAFWSSILASTVLNLLEIIQKDVKIVCQIA